MYTVTKTYGHDRGLSCCYRQPKATSHCHLIHGYALAFEFCFQALELDHRNWVIDFGGLKPLEEWLKKEFDHTCLVAFDDPSVSVFNDLMFKGLIELRIMNKVGCEAFAQRAFEVASDIVVRIEPGGRITVKSCKVSEHGANSATYSV